MRPFPLLPPWSSCSDIANLSAHLHRLPTPSAYLRRIRLSPGRARRCWVANDAAGCSWHSSCKSPSTQIPVLRTSGVHWRARWFAGSSLSASRCHFSLFPMVGLIHSFNKYGRPASLYDFIRSPVWVLCSALCLPPRLRVSRSTLLILTHRANYVNSRIHRLLLRISPTLAESITAPLGRWGMTG